MRKNIRRSLVVAAAASGIWALTSAAASAAELPVPSGAGVTAGGAAEAAEQAGGAGQGTVAGAVRGAEHAAKRVTGTVEDVARGVTGKLPSKGIPENGLPTNTLPTGTLPTGTLPTGSLTTGGLPTGAGAEDAARGAGVAGAAGDAKGAAAAAGYGRAEQADHAVQEAREGLDLRPSAPGLPAVPAVPAAPSVPGTGAVSGLLPARTLPARTLPARTLPAVPAAPGTGLRHDGPAAGLGGGHAQDTVGKVRNTAAAAHPVLDGASGAVLPPAGRGAALQARAMGYQLATDAAAAADSAWAATAPFAGRTGHRAHALAHDVHGQAAGFGEGVATDAAGYAGELSTGAHADGDALASHAVTDVWLLVAGPAQRDLTDPANIPGLPASSRMPAGR